MKRVLEEEEILHCCISQSDVPGGAEACTSIAVVACMETLFPSKQEEQDAMERWILRGATLHSSAGRMTHAKEVLDRVTEAWPIRAGPDERGGRMEELDLYELDAAAVLTCGAYSVAILNQGTHMFDSHTGQLVKCASPEALVTYLREQLFPNNPDMLFSLCPVERRPYAEKPRVFSTQAAAFEAADGLPLGCFHVWARDVHPKTGAKEYLVAGLEDFLHYYETLDEDQRCFYDMARTDRPLSLYMDLEYELFDNGCNDHHNPQEMLQIIKDLIGGDPESFRVYDASSIPPADEEASLDLESMSISSDDDEEEEKKESRGKVSFHVHNHRLWFPDAAAMETYVRDLMERDPRLQVWRQKKKKEGSYEMQKKFFADMTVYSANRCFRLPFSSKMGQQRPFKPMNSAWGVADALISPPMKELFQLQQKQYEQRGTTRRSIEAASISPSVFAEAPPVIQRLGSFVEQQFRPERMRGFQVTPNGLVTFTMIKHDCSICNARHSNQVYVVVDLKRRIAYEKCHKDRSKSGAEVPLPADLSLSMAHREEMVENNVFPAESSTARLVLGFARAVFEGAYAAPSIPESLPTRYLGSCYEASLPGSCKHDGGDLVLEVTRTGTVIRCKGQECSKRGTRWRRPTTTRWDLGFLFPESLQEDAIIEDVPVLLPDDEQFFISEPNFYLALGLDVNTASKAAILARLKVYEQRVPNKVKVIKQILCNPKKETMAACYRECLAVDPTFAYPLDLIPREPSTLVCALWMHLTKTRGYKRVEDDFYVPFERDGHMFYRSCSRENLLTSVFTYDVTPNICESILWNKRASDSLHNMLKDRNHFPSLTISKRYMGFQNVVYDLEQNVTLTWEQVRMDPSVMPFNYLDVVFPVDALEQAKASCPQVRLNQDGELEFEGGAFQCQTPLFDGTLHDQRFTPAMIFCLYALLGRMFYYVGKQNGDNWEVVLFLLGAPKTFKSSIISILQWFFQVEQVGVIGTRVEKQFPLDGIPGKLIGVMAESGGCTMDRDLFKQVASGDPIKISGKYKTATNLPNWLIPLIFAGNSFFRMHDMDGSVERRVAVFPFRYITSSSSPDLVQRIIQEEGPLLLIKWNTMYRAVLTCIGRRSIQPLLPRLVREATHQAVISGDSFKSFVDQQLIPEEHQRLTWGNLWQAFLAWCRNTGRIPYAVDPFSVEVQTMFRSCLQVHLSQSASPLTLVGVRLRNHQADAPYQSVFEVRSCSCSSSSNDE